MSEKGWVLSGPEAAAYYQELMQARQDRHVYTSTACQHGLHVRCRLICKFCETSCICDCHQPGGSSPASTPPEEP